MSSDAKENIRDKLRCRLTGAVRGFGTAPWECRYFSLSPVFVGLKCAQASRVSVYLSAFTFLLVVFIDFLPRFCFVSSTRQGYLLVVQQLYLLCFLSFLRVYHVHSFFFFFFFFFFFWFCFSSFFFFSFFIFCIYYQFILAEDLCVHFTLLLSSFSFSGGFLVKGAFTLFNFNLCIGCQGVKMYF